MDIVVFGSGSCFENRSEVGTCRSNSVDVFVTFAFCEILSAFQVE